MTGVLGIDAGQSTMKLRFAGTDGTIADESVPGVLTDRPLLPQLEAAARTAISLSGRRPDALVAGVSGLTDGDADAAGLALLLRDTSIRRVVLAHDSTTSFLGALGFARGAVVAAGTGVVTLGVGRCAVARVDGWGHSMGDAGSGFWIGHEALGAVMRAFDGRGPATALTAAVVRVWPDLPDAYVALQGESDWVGRIASFATDVAAAAEAGDAVATRITHDAARELALSVTTALARVDAQHDPDARIAAVGGVFRSAALRASFAEHLVAAGVAVPLTPAVGTGIDGVMALADLDAGHPFARQVWRS